MSLTYFLLYLIIAILMAAVFYIQKRQNYWKDRGIPSDPPHPLMGNLKGFRKNYILHDIYSEIYKKYKGLTPFCGIFYFMRPAAFILDRQLAKDILIKYFSNFAHRGHYYNEKDDPLTGHLFFLDGIKWKQLRHKLSPTFTSGKIKFMCPTVVEVGERFIKILGDLIKKDNNNSIEITELCARFTTDVIGTCVFGIECNSLKDPKAEFRLMGNKVFTKSRHGRFLMGFMTSFPNLARKLHMRRIHEDVHQFFMRAVRETVTFREQNKIKRNDFMDLLIELKNTKTMKLENGEILTGFTLEEIAAQAYIFFLAGFLTSSTTIGYALYELACHQDMQDKARQEINEILIKHNNKITYESIKDMRYLKQIIYEILRLYSLVPHLLREAIEDFRIPSNPKMIIEKGTKVIIPSSAYHHDPELYPEPKAFKPERFSKEAIADRDSIEWLPFGDGPRTCIGKNFGKMQTTIGLALLLKNFKFTVCENTQIPIKFNPMSVVLTPIDGIKLHVEKVL